MFEEYLFDSDDFLTEARKLKIEDEVKAKRYYRGSIFFAASALEAFVNYTAESFNLAENLSPFEIAFLTDKRIQYSVDKLDIVERTEYHKLDEKTKVLIKRFIPDYDFNNSSWSDFHEFKQFRDSLVHPKKSEDTVTIEEYDNMISKGLNTVIEIMNVLSNGLYKKSLRPKILDLKPGS